MNLSFSTCWNSMRHSRGDEMLREIQRLGFDHVELSHGIRLSLWEGIEHFLADNPMAVTSLHNFCPLPIEVLFPAPDCYQCTSEYRAERERAHRYTLQTIDYAHKIGARSVVMHLGSATSADDTTRLLRTIQNCHYLDRTYVKLKLNAIIRREQYSGYDRVTRWLRPVLEHARAAGILLGIENRIGIETFPSEREFRRLFNDIPDPHLGYWHDFGHAQIRHNLTFIDHFEWLSEMTRRLIGCHVHDVRFPSRDHCAPFTGMIDFHNLFQVIPEEIPVVWELSSKVPPEEILTARAQWETTFSLRLRK